MPDYQMYLLGPAGQLSRSGRDADCIDDASAFQFAQSFFNHGKQVEVWSGTRFVGKISTPPSALFWLVQPASELAE